MYTRFSDNDTVTRQAQELVTSTWSNNTNNLTVAYTSSTQAVFTTATSSGQFFIDVYDKPVQTALSYTADTTTEVQYSVAFGHKAGSGSPDFTNDTGSFGLSSTRTTYNQYRQLHYNDDTKFFKFGDHTPDSIYVINVNRARYKQRLTLGTLNLQISGNSVDLTPAQQNLIHLTDDSVTNTTAAGTSVSLGPYYNVVSGSSGTVLSGTTSTAQLDSSGSYGFFYPEAGLIILNGEAFGGTLSPRGASTGLSTNTDKFHEKLVRHISNEGNQIMGAVAAHTGSFIVDSTEEINSEFYFCRARNDQFNYTNNESFVDASKNIRFESMKLNPKVFITTIGLYNDAFECLAVAKLSQPVAKDFTKEALIRVKLDY
jgi:hypothetical protein